MSLPREQKKAQPPWLDLAVFAAVLAFLGYSVQSFLGGRAVVKPTAPSLEPATPLPAPERAPASQTTAGSTEVLRVPCLHEGKRDFTSSARLLQIHSALCGDDGQSTSWSATNQTSGEQIMVFVNRKEKTISTSYFNLKDGRNELVFVEELGHGKSQSEKVLVTKKTE